MRISATQSQETAEPTNGQLKPLYVRADQALALLPISRRCLGNWMKRKLLPHYRIGRVVMFRVTDIEKALEKFRVVAVGEPKPRRS